MAGAADYVEAELKLSKDIQEGANTEQSSYHAKRRAAQLALDVEGLVDRFGLDADVSKNSVRKRFAEFCSWPLVVGHRPSALKRIRAVADAYKHFELTNKDHPISSNDAVMVLGTIGVDGFGIGKFCGQEVLVEEADKRRYKFLGDAPAAIQAWFCFLEANGERFGSENMKSATCRYTLQFIQK